MLGRESPEQQLPPTVALSEPDGRIAQVAFALADPERVLILQALGQEDVPQTAADLAKAAGVNEPVAEGHLKILAANGLVRTARTGLLRRKAYLTDICDVEIRFRGGEKAKGASRKTLEHVEREAKKRAKDAKRQARAAAKVAKKRASLDE